MTVTIDIINKLIDMLNDSYQSVTPEPWKEEYAYNGAGIPISNFFIPGHNQNKSVEMLSQDAEFIVMFRNNAKEILKLAKLGYAIANCPEPEIPIIPFREK